MNATPCEWAGGRKRIVLMKLHCDVASLVSLLTCLCVPGVPGAPQAVTAKSRQVQSLESELAAVRRSERSMREEVGALRAELGQFAQVGGRVRGGGGWAGASAPEALQTWWAWSWGCIMKRACALDGSACLSLCAVAGGLCIARIARLA